MCPEQDSNLHAVKPASAPQADVSTNFTIWAIFRAENETRTRDPDLGKVVLYQLSYFRIT